MTDQELIARLQVDVFYGDARLHNMSRHNPLHMEAADRIEELVKERDNWKVASQAGYRANIEILKRVQSAEARATRLEDDRDAAWKRAEHAEKMWGEAHTKKQESLNAR